MESLYLLIPIALVFVVVAIKAFFWAVDNRQFDDLDSAGHQILFDDDPAPPPAADSEHAADNADANPRQHD